MLTEEEEKILKLEAQKIKARVKLNKINVEMGTAIRAEFSAIDQRIRKENEPLFLPLEAEVKACDDELRALLE